MRNCWLFGLCFALLCAAAPAVAGNWLPYNPTAAVAANAIGDPYAVGPYDVATLDVPPWRRFAGARVPVKTRIYAPTVAGAYPVLLLFNCFACGPGFHDEIMQHVASHGFIIVSPQLHQPVDIATTKNLSFADADKAEAVWAWLEGSLDNFLGRKVAPGVAAQLGTVGLIAFSSGAKPAWILAERGTIPFSALAGMMPVDNGGDPFGWIVEPTVLDAPFDIAAPTLVLGTGNDPIPRMQQMPACGPAGRNHEVFFELARSPAWHVVGTGNGHMDVLDSDLAQFSGAICPTTRPTAELRGLAQGLLTAFFLGTLAGEEEYLGDLTDTAAMPTVVQVTRK